jgi:hypothetical protein
LIWLTLAASALDGVNAEDINTLPFYPSARARADVSNEHIRKRAKAQRQRVCLEIRRLGVRISLAAHTALLKDCRSLGLQHLLVNTRPNQQCEEVPTGD